MRLLNVETLQLEFIPAPDVSRLYRYAILSHTWEHDEVSFAQLQDLDRAQTQAGFWKIDKTCRQAKKDGYRYAWIDTCCIDKSSSAELHEAINSMFRWYKQSSVCYAYLSDVPGLGEDHKDDYEKGFYESKWFKRGWTLQELIAPSVLIFYDRDWKALGTRTEWAEGITVLTSIPKLLLKSTPPEYPGELIGADAIARFSVAERMSWAALRRTTRIEDEAYCLLGLFNINMPLLYGEGKAAFARLQEEILRTSSDLSILLWRHARGDEDDVPELLAPSPSAFMHCHNIQFVPTKQLIIDAADRTISSHGFRMNAPVAIGTAEHGTYVSLNCYDKEDPTRTIVLRAGLELRHQSSRLQMDTTEVPMSEILVLFPGMNEWNITTAGLENRTAKIDAVTADEDTSMRTIILARSARSVDDASIGSSSYDEYVWLRWSSVADGPAWEAVATWPADVWRCTASSAHCATMEAAQKSLRSHSFPLAFGAVSLRKRDVNNSRVAVAFARQRIFQEIDPWIHVATRKSLYITVENVTDLQPAEDESYLKSLCRKLQTEIAPAEDEAAAVDHRHEARGVHLYDSTGVFDGAAFAIKPEIRMVGSNRMVILHIHDLQSLDEIGSL